MVTFIMYKTFRNEFIEPIPGSVGDITAPMGILMII